MPKYTPNQIEVNEVSRRYIGDKNVSKDGVNKEVTD
ncbi:hypothetical protein BH10ACI3_BH10ACI3_26510 [soil metagenome]